MAALERGELTVVQLKEGLPQSVYASPKGLGVLRSEIGTGRPGASRRAPGAVAGQDDDARFV